MNVKNRVKIIEHANKELVGKTGFIASSGGIMWRGARKLGTDKPLMKGGDGDPTWWVKVDGLDDSILCLEKHLELIE